MENSSYSRQSDSAGLKTTKQTKLYGGVRLKLGKSFSFDVLASSGGDEKKPNNDEKDGDKKDKGSSSKDSKTKGSSSTKAGKMYKPAA